MLASGFFHNPSPTPSFTMMKPLLSCRTWCIVFSLVMVLFLPVRTLAQEGKKTKPKQPNILFIYTDDQSYKTLSCYPEAYRWVKTPNLDRLARMGIRFQAIRFRITAQGLVGLVIRV